MPTDDKLELLRAVPLFQRLSNAQLTRLGQLTDEVDVPAGRVLMRQGDVGNQMFVMASGRASVDRDGQSVGQLGEGDWFGEMALLSEGPRNATVTTTEPSRLFVIGHHDFHALMDEMPAIRQSVLECVADRLRTAEADSTF